MTMVRAGADEDSEGAPSTGGAEMLPLRGLNELDLENTKRA